MTKEISVARALNELKLTSSKISSKTNSLLVAQLAISSKTKEETRKEFKDKFKADYQQVKDLIKYRDALKAAIVASNAITDVTVAGVVMKVSEAIERKNSIQLQKDLNTKLRNAYYSVASNVEQHNKQVSTKADQQASTALSGLTDNVAEQHQKLVDTYIKASEAEVLAVNGIEALIEEEAQKIAEFESDVDFALSESNVKTLIKLS